MLLFSFQGYFEGFRWVAQNWRLLAGLFAGSWVWIVVLTLLALALSAWVKWKPVAGALMFGVFFISSAFGFIVNTTLRTSWGHLINLRQPDRDGLGHLVRSPHAARRGRGVLPAVAPGETMPAWACWLSLTLICLGCLELLAIKIRGRGGGQMSSDRIVFEDVSRFYGEVLGINRVNVSIPPGVHQPGGAQRQRQDHAHEPDGRVDPAHARPYSRARDPAGPPGPALPADGLLHAGGLVRSRSLRVPNSSTPISASTAARTPRPTARRG